MQLETAARNAIADAFVDLIDAGAAAGKLVIGTSGMAQTLVTFTLNDPAFGAAAAGVATLDVDPAISEEIAATGTAAEAQLTDSDDTVYATLTVGTSASDINFDSVAFVDGGTAEITSLTITCPAS
jgi:hypothetical protein